MVEYGLSMLICNYCVVNIPIMNTNLYCLCISKEYCMIPLLHVAYMYSQAPKCASANNNTAAIMKLFTSCKLFSLQRLLGTVFCEKDISKVFESVANNLTSSLGNKRRFIMYRQ